MQSLLRFLIAACLLMSAASHTDAATPAAMVESVTFQTEPPPFCGRCDTIKFVASPDGRVQIERGH